MIRRFFTRILMVILIAACGYNWLQMQALQRQIKQLQAGAIRSQPGVARAPAPETPLFDLQTQWKHLRREADAFHIVTWKVFTHEPPI